jgi:hypothetical protein
MEVLAQVVFDIAVGVDHPNDVLRGKIPRLANRLATSNGGLNRCTNPAGI